MDNTKKCAASSHPSKLHSTTAATSSTVRSTTVAASDITTYTISLPAAPILMPNQTSKCRRLLPNPAPRCQSLILPKFTCSSKIVNTSKMVKNNVCAKVPIRRNVSAFSPGVLTPNAAQPSATFLLIDPSQRGVLIPNNATILPGSIVSGSAPKLLPVPILPKSTNAVTSIQIRSPQRLCPRPQRHKKPSKAKILQETLQPSSRPILPKASLSSSTFLLPNISNSNNAISLQPKISNVKTAFTQKSKLSNSNKAVTSIISSHFGSQHSSTVDSSLGFQSGNPVCTPVVYSKEQNTVADISSASPINRVNMYQKNVSARVSKDHSFKSTTRQISPKNNRLMAVGHYDSHVAERQSDLLDTRVHDVANNNVSTCGRGKTINTQVFAPVKYQSHVKVLDDLDVLSVGEKRFKSSSDLALCGVIEDEPLNDNICYTNRNTLDTSFNQSSSIGASEIVSNRTCTITISEEFLTSLNAKRELVEAEENSHMIDEKHKSEKNIIHTKSRIEKNKRKLCQICGKLLLGSSSLQSHLLTHNTNKRLSCSVCHKRFHRRSNLKTHLRTHSGDRPFSCDGCSASFKTKNQMLIHLKTHEHENMQHQCHVCYKVFSSKFGLSSHKRIHMYNESYQCELCEKTFKSSTGLKLHVLTHKYPDRKHTCSICEKSFVFRSYLLRHMELHNGGKLEYSCHVCDDKFMWKTSLVSHLQIHATKKFKCKHCPLSFHSQLKLIAHSKKHSNPKPHVCTLCLKKFEYQYLLKRHMKGAHGHQQFSLVQAKKTKGKKPSIRNLVNKEQTVSLPAANLDSNSNAIPTEAKKQGINNDDQSSFNLEVQQVCRELENDLAGQSLLPEKSEVNSQPVVSNNFSQSMVDTTQSSVEPDRREPPPSYSSSPRARHNTQPSSVTNFPQHSLATQSQQPQNNVVPSYESPHNSCFSFPPLHPNLMAASTDPYLQSSFTESPMHSLSPQSSLIQSDAVTPNVAKVSSGIKAQFSPPSSLVYNNLGEAPSPFIHEDQTVDPTRFTSIINSDAHFSLENPGATNQLGYSPQPALLFNNSATNEAQYTSQSSSNQDQFTSLPSNEHQYTTLSSSTEAQYTPKANEAQYLTQSSYEAQYSSQSSNELQYSSNEVQYSSQSSSIEPQYSSQTFHNNNPADNFPQPSATSSHFPEDQSQLSDRSAYYNIPGTYTNSTLPPLNNSNNPYVSLHDRSPQSNNSSTRYIPASYGSSPINGSPMFGIGYCSPYEFPAPLPPQQENSYSTPPSGIPSKDGHAQLPTFEQDPALSVNQADSPAATTDSPF